MKNLTLGYFYKKLLNLYGDNGNVEVLCHRAQKRGIAVTVVEVEVDTVVDTAFMKKLDIVFMGGGPDSAQKDMYIDLLSKKGPYLAEYINSEGIGLYICGSYQLLGKYFKAADGSILEGLGIFDLYTESDNSRRCVGNIRAKLTEYLLTDPFFKANNFLGDTIVGFENHGGRTYLGKTEKCLATVTRGFGNNGKDKTEGILHGNSFGTYCHGPFLAKNPHVADYLLAKALKEPKLQRLDDRLVFASHTASTKLKQ